MAAGTPLSYSSVRTYLECPLRWKFLYVDKIPEAPRGYFSFGRTIHSVLEELLLPLVTPSARTTAPGLSQRTLDEWKGSSAPEPAGRLWSVEEMLARYRTLWVPDGYLSGDDEARYRRLGEEMLMGFHASLGKHPPHPVAIEAHLEARWNGIPVHGYIDRIDRTPDGGLEVLDYKTSRELRREDAVESDQLTLYQVLVEKNFPDPVERLTLYHLRTLTPLRTPARPQAALENLHERVGVVSDGIRAQAFEPTPGRQCSRCEFKAQCPEFREVPEPERVRLSELVDRFQALRAREGEVERELRATAEALHAEAERLGVHRVPGQHGVALRRRQEHWTFPPEVVGPLLKAHGLVPASVGADGAALRRLIRDPKVDAELRRRIAEAGGRTLQWYWDLEEA
ncbi:MAG: PD-(D/E)XK nuclease family protein [Thermoplasmata archaeon]|nr:PD-(D/E)XK nuclease family protein [Thermoplasmata archaeon]